MRQLLSARLLSGVAFNVRRVRESIPGRPPHATCVMLAGAAEGGETGIAEAGTAAKPNSVSADVSRIFRMTFPPKSRSRTNSSYLGCRSR